MFKPFFCNLPGNCEGFDFTNKDQQHVVTGHFWIISNKLRKSFPKEPKYRKTNISHGKKLNLKAKGSH